MQTFMQHVKRSLWLLPFVLFLGGYQFLAHLYVIEYIETPNVIGKTVQEALSILSNNNLNSRLLSYKEDANLPSGTIISQVPQSTTKIKPNQSVFLVISTKPPTLKAPAYVHKLLPEIITNAEVTKIRLKYYYLDCHYPKDLCIAQFPAPGKDLENNKVIVYIASGNQKPVLLPNFINKTIPAVMEFLDSHGIKASTIHQEFCEPTHICDHRCTITDQRPLAGSLIDLDKPPNIQLQVRFCHPRPFD